MNRAVFLYVGVLATVLLSFVGLVTIPERQLGSLEPVMDVEGRAHPVEPTGLVAEGRVVYKGLGCMYCHSQQVRPEGFGNDQGRFWGRPSVPADYVYDKPHQLGTMRTGPDLMNIAVRQPSEQWHLVHLYNPRVVTPGSIMPPFPWLFEEKRSPAPNDIIIELPDSLSPKNGVIVAGREANALVAYLLSLDRSYPVAQGILDSVRITK